MIGGKIIDILANFSRHAVKLGSQACLKLGAETTHNCSSYYRNIFCFLAQ